MSDENVIKNDEYKMPLPARIGEGVFCLVYLIFVISMAFLFRDKAREIINVINNSDLVDEMLRLQGLRYSFGFGLAVLLALGDAFHLVPRIIVAFKGDMNRKYFFLGLGNLISSITMTLYYNVLIGAGDSLEYSPSQYNYGIEKAILILSIIRIVVLLMPMNKWYTKEGDKKWAIIRNAIFSVIGILTVIGYINVIFHADNYSVAMYVNILIAVILSFLFYLPVAIYGREKPKLGMLMIPKTLCYMWMLLVLYMW
ncbi:MAG: hypothetical protein K6E10_02555 [Eubacterium sp.]|nr:hypothetical protein [Eubacterium sp.]